MKNQRKIKRSLLWGLKGLLSVALSGLGIAVFAQGAEVCQGTGYTIADAVPASAGSEYRWLENGNVLANTNQATYDVPNDKAAGVYTYVRQSKSSDCPDWQSSNEFTVTVFACTFTVPDQTPGATATFTDPRDGKNYKIVRMPDDRIWFAQNLNYTKNLTFNVYAAEANGKPFTSQENGVSAIGSYWCPGASGSTYSGDRNLCNIYGALYTWETAMMVDGKYADETKTSNVWDELWVSNNYFAWGTVPTSNNNANVNNARAGRGICPMGWHVPTVYEWLVMICAVDNCTEPFPALNVNAFGTNASVKLRAASTYTGAETGDGRWQSSAYNGTDDFGFTVLPSGTRMRNGTFIERGIGSNHASSDVLSAQSRLAYSTPYNWTRIFYRNIQRDIGSSVRCIRD